MRHDVVGSNLAPVILALAWGVASGCAARAQEPGEIRVLPTDDGYRGIWYMNQPTRDDYRYKYSGGFATYPQQHLPIAVHAPEAHRTFFVYGGRPAGANRLLHMVSYFDHETGQVPRPRILLDKETDDAHDNPTLMLDGAGHLWIFSNSHGTSRPSTIHRSVQPYSIDAFERVLTTNFSYGQPWFVPDQGFLFLHTRYAQGDRRLFWMTSPDGRAWSEPSLLASFEKGHYQVSWREGSRIGTAFNMHPRPVGLNARTNLYYVETSDSGRTWRNAAGEVLRVPLESAANPALVHDYQAEGLLVYMKDLQYDAQGHPVILFLTTRGFEPGPENGPRVWRTARWTGDSWEIRDVTESDHNYDFGSLYVEADGTWRLIAPTDPGPQPWSTGGEIVLWISRDQGKTWTRDKTLTPESARNHTYVRRPVNAHPDFYGFWADGHALEPSESDLFFTDREGSHVWRLPRSMDGETAAPEVVWTP